MWTMRASQTTRAASLWTRRCSCRAYGLLSTLPIKAMVRNLRIEGIPASVSNTAGTFVCNHVFMR